MVFKMKEKIKIGVLNKKDRWFVSSIFLEKNFYKNLSRFADVIEIPFKDETKIDFKKLENLDLDYIYFNIMDCSFYPFLYRDLNQVNTPLIFITHTISPWILHYILIAPLIRKDDVIINLSRFAQKQLNKVLNGFNSYIINHSLDIDSIRKSTSKIGHDSKTITYLGRVVERKNVHGLINCLPAVKKAFPAFKLNIIGSLSGNKMGNKPSPYVKKLKRIIKKLQLEDNVNFLGVVSDSEKFKLLKKSRILVHPTLAIEESTIVVIAEAFACGTPVICSYWAGAPEFIINNKNGFLIDVKWIKNKPKMNEKQFTNSIIKILKDDDLFKRMSKNAEKSALNFDYKKNIPKIIGLLSKIKERNIELRWNNIKNKKVKELKKLYNPNILDKFIRNLKFSDIKDVIENRNEIRRRFYKKHFRYMSYQS